MRMQNVNDIYSLNIYLVIRNIICEKKVLFFFKEGIMLK
jgi:hypothetical protein